jgi:hypothetical protein
LGNPIFVYSSTLWPSGNPKAAYLFPPIAPEARWPEGGWFLLSNGNLKTKISAGGHNFNVFII